MPGPGRQKQGKKRGRARRGTGAIWEYKPGRYRGLLDLGVNAEGKRIRVSATGGSVAEVQQKLDGLRQDALKGLPVKPEKLTVAQHFEDWLRSKKPSLAATTHDKYERVYKTHIKPLFGGLLLGDLDYRRINAFYELLDEKGLSATYVHDIANVLRMGLEDGVRKKLIRHNPAKMAASRSLPDTEARFLTPDEVRRFLQAARGEWLEPFFILLLHTGLRAGEALGLTWDAVDLQQHKLSVRQGMVEVGGAQHLKAPKTAAARRTISLSAEAVAALRRQRKRQLEAQLEAGPRWSNTHGLVFTNRVGEFMSKTNIYRRDLRRVLNRAAVLAAAERLGCDPAATLALNGPHLPARPLRAGDKIALPDGRQGELAASDLMEGVGLHAFRHTHASMLIAQGIDILAVSRRLGHKNIGVTLGLYGHLLPGQDERAAAAMDQFMKGLGT